MLISILPSGPTLIISLRSRTARPMDARWSYSKGSGESMGMGCRQGPKLIQSRTISVFCRVSCSNVFSGSVVPHVLSGINDFQCLQHL